MFEWFNKLQPAQATIIAALFGAAITVLIAIVTIAIKDFWFPILSESRAAFKKRNETFRLYGNPLILSSISLLFRIKEILSNRGHFLLEDYPKNEFIEYKYISTMYRLCCFLGWLRASILELSLIEVKSNKQYKKIQESIASFECTLADGQNVEVAVLEDLGKLWKMNILNLSALEKEHLGVKIENATDMYCYREKVEKVNQLSPNVQKHLAVELNKLIATAAGYSPLSDDEILSTLADFSKELSRTLGLIYRDWQAAIGDLMLKKNEKESRKFEVIGYKEFEALYLSENPENNKWLKRANRVFKNLDVTIEERFDGRTRQLKDLYKSVYEILEALSKIKTSNVDVASNALKKLPNIIL